MKNNKQKKILITGCAGFIGYHLTKYYLKKKYLVIGIDNLSREGTHYNLKALQKASNFAFYKEDVRNFKKITQIFKEHQPFDLIIHEAGQVAVTTSIVNPREDFEINALGAFNLLEATRLYSPKSVFIYPSTNKVYGSFNHLKMVEDEEKYRFTTLTKGIGEKAALDFHSPYGCSKGAADQYVRDYHRIYGLKTIVLRQSCIYGTRQFGLTDQGWVAWFILAAMLNKPLTVFGNGKQVRDVLWIGDLVKAYDLLYRNAGRASGQIFNIGGGLDNCLSLLELIQYLREKQILGQDIIYRDWRSGDQKIYISDVSKIKTFISWKPRTSVQSGLEKTIKWVSKNKKLLSELY